MTDVINTHIDTIRNILDKGKNAVIDQEYIDVLIEEFDFLFTNDDSITDTIAVAMTKVLDAVIKCALDTNDSSKIASTFMAQTSGAKDLTIAHTNILMTAITLAFRQGNEILYYISKYNSYISKLCLEKITILI